ncbi:MAG: DUF433 domain-containing protein [Synechococcaceae cyanobacterium SM2_3_2]|nr:DUF433 domain-containing protein [Synechococcaceae cyanobacterium SM2_3_2]
MNYLATDYKHIQLDENQVPVIEGSTMKVVELITSHLAHGWSPEELHFQYPHISLGKIYSALAYYWDHQAALDSDMKQRLEKASPPDRAVSATGDPLVGLFSSSPDLATRSKDILR